MEPISTTMAVMAGLNHLYNTTKNLKDLDLKLHEATLKGQLIELHLSVVELKSAILELKNENLEKDSRIIALENQIKQKVEMVWEDPFYFKHSADGVKDGPYCQQCYDSKNNPVRLPRPEIDNPWYLCKVCGSNYENPNFTSSSSSTLDTSYNPLDWME